MTKERRELDRFQGDCTPGAVNRPSEVLSSPACGSIISQPDEDRRWDATTWGFGLDYQLNDDIFFYGKVDKGYRSGGFEGRTSQPERTFEEEFVTTYEVGTKADWLDSRVRTNLSAFWSKYKDIQNTILLFSPGGITTDVVNSGTADIPGVEFELYTRLLPGLELNGTVGWFTLRYKTGPFSEGPPNFFSGNQNIAP